MTTLSPGPHSGDLSGDALAESRSALHAKRGAHETRARFSQAKEGGIG